jgi:hypothetical protein
MSRKELGITLVRLVAAYALLLILFECFGAKFARALLPFFQWRIERTPGLEVPAFDVAWGEDGTVVTGTVRVWDVAAGVRGPASRPTYRRDLPITDIGFGLEASQIYLYPIIALSLIAAWPSLRARRRALAFLVAVPVLATVEALDVPLMVLCRSDATMHRTMAFGFLPHRPVVAGWLDFLARGGRQALPVLAAALCVCVAIAIDRAKREMPAAERARRTTRDTPRHRTVSVRSQRACA